MGRRINERNTGDWSVNSEPKKRGKKDKPLPPLTPQQEKALDLYMRIQNLLKSYKNNYYSYVRFDDTDILIKSFIDEGIITKGIRKATIKHFEDIEICHLNPDKISVLEKRAESLKDVFEFKLYI